MSKRPAISPGRIAHVERRLAELERDAADPLGRQQGLRAAQYLKLGAFDVDLQKVDSVHAGGGAISVEGGRFHVLVPDRAGIHPVVGKRPIGQRVEGLERPVIAMEANAAGPVRQREAVHGDVGSGRLRHRRTERLESRRRGFESVDGAAARKLGEEHRQSADMGADVEHRHALANVGAIEDALLALHFLEARRSKVPENMKQHAAQPARSEALRMSSIRAARRSKP